MKKITILLLSLIISLITYATPSWESSALTNGQLRIDGQLHKRFNLGILRGSPEFSFPIYLEHNLSKYPYEKFNKFSHWTIPQLTSYAMPMNNGVFWLSPSGEEHLFSSRNEKSPLLKTTPTNVRTNYVAVQAKSDSDRIEIISKDKFTYVYEQGLLKTLRAPSGRVLYFQTNGIRITSIQQRVNSKIYRLLEAEYDDKNRVKQLEISDKKYTFDYDADSEILTSFTPQNIPERQINFEYNNGIISSIKEPNNEIERFKWLTNLKDFELSGNRYIDNKEFEPVLLSDKDNLYSFGQSKEGIFMQKTNMLDNSDNVIYNPMTNTLTTIDKGGVKRSVQWGRGFENQATGKLTEIISPKGEKLVELDYDEFGRISQMTKRGQKPILYKYDDQDRIIEVKEGDYPPTKYQYDTISMRPKRIIDSVGATQDFTYTEDNQIQSYKNQAGAIQRFNYDKLGRITRRSFPYGIWIAWEYDNLGRVSKRSHSNGDIVKFTYDKNGQVQKVEDNKNIVWVYEYAPTGRLKKLKRNSETWLEIDSEIKDEKEYTSIIDNKGRETKKAYSLDGKLLEEINPLNEITEYNYDPIGQLKGWKAPDGSSVKFDYNESGEMTFHENSIGQKFENQYDDFGNFVEKKTGEQIINIEYDQFDRPIKRKYAKGEEISISYDEYGRIDEVKSTKESIEIEYDCLNRPIKRILTHTNGDKSVVVIKYAKNGMRDRVDTAIQSSDKNKKEQNTVEYSYDILNRPYKVTINKTSNISYIYDKKSQMLTIKEYSNGNKSIYNYDKHSRLESIENYDKSNTPTSSIRYDWDLDGNLKGKKMW